MIRLTQLVIYYKLLIIRSDRHSLTRKCIKKWQSLILLLKICYIYVIIHFYNWVQNSLCTVRISSSMNDLILLIVTLQIRFIVLRKKILRHFFDSLWEDFHEQRGRTRFAPISAIYRRTETARGGYESRSVLFTIFLKVGYRRIGSSSQRVGCLVAWLLTAEQK